MYTELISHLSHKFKVVVCGHSLGYVKLTTGCLCVKDANEVVNLHVEVRKLPSQDTDISRETVPTLRLAMSGRGIRPAYPF